MPGWNTRYDQYLNGWDVLTLTRWTGWRDFESTTDTETCRYESEAHPKVATATSSGRKAKILTKLGTGRINMHFRRARQSKTRQQIPLGKIAAVCSEKGFQSRCVQLSCLDGDPRVASFPRGHWALRRNPFGILGLRLVIQGGLHLAKAAVLMRGARRGGRPGRQDERNSAYISS